MTAALGGACCVCGFTVLADSFSDRAFSPDWTGAMSAVTPCFTPGTLIATDRGWRPVERLRRADRVVTRDNGLRRIAWAGRRNVSYADIADAPDLAPILVQRNAFGDGRPSRDMLVSPNHRFLATDTDGEELLVAVKHLVGRPGVSVARTLGVSYLHILLGAHEVILANGVWTESFHPEEPTLQGLAEDTRAEILKLFPEIETLGAARRFPAARPLSQSRFER